jgi:cell division protein FtsQ
MKARRIVRILSALLALSLLVYIIIVAVRFKSSHQNIPCKEVTVTIKSENDKKFISANDIIAALKQARLYPVEQPMRTVNTDKIELELRRNGLISQVEAYKTASGTIKIKITEKKPILRIMTASEDYYIDSKGSIMPANIKYAVYAPIASGYIEKSLATADLYKFALFLQENEFWDSQIEQIYIHPDKQVELIPRVGDHRIMLGTFEDFKEKLSNLRLFYEQATPKIGWNKYRLINLKYKNQIVCTKNRGL